MNVLTLRRYLYAPLTVWYCAFDGLLTLRGVLPQRPTHNSRPLVLGHFEPIAASRLPVTAAETSPFSLILDSLCHVNLKGNLSAVAAKLW